MARDVRSHGQEVEISSEAFAYLSALAASAPEDVEGLLFGRVRRPAVREQFSDGDAPSNAAEKDRPCIVAESFHLLGACQEKGTLITQKAPEKWAVVFSPQVKDEIKEKCSESGQQLLGFCCIRAASLQTGTSQRELHLMQAVCDAVGQGGWLHVLEGIKPVDLCLERDNQVGDLGAFVCKSVCKSIASTLPTLHVNVRSIGKTVEAEPTVPRLPPANVSLQTPFNQAEVASRATIETLMSSVVESFKLLRQDRLDELGAMLNDDARLADSALTQSSAVKDPKASLETETKSPEQTAPQPPVSLPSHTQQERTLTVEPSDRKRQAEVEPAKAMAADPTNRKQNQMYLSRYVKASTCQRRKISDE